MTIHFKGETIVLIGRLHFLVKSKSEPDAWHCVDLEPLAALDRAGDLTLDDDWPEAGCTCVGHRVRKDCRHLRVCRALAGLTIDVLR